ncbi:MAG TPA: TIGR03013 family XrtA/PEP-CTERM system glycosyltransferase, partial [Nitrospiria bacterium]|nr:TIGR03013 family XrtA/PEP-CTERM system glycosyltransferase [Nitrospiria bacterium]
PFAVILWRTALTKWVRNSLFERKILLVGNGRLAEDVISALNVTPSFGHTIADRLQSWPLPEYSGEGDRPRSLLKLARDARIDHVVVALGDSRGRLPIDDLLQCKFSGLTVEDGLSFYERICGKVHIDALKPSWLIFSEGFKCRYGAVVVKRAFDLVGSAIGLVVLMPLGLLLAALIKLDSRGPVLYRQVRVGEHERPFVLVKFRSMRTDAEQGTGAVWAKRDDNRVTRIGKWLRLLRLDELPQLINVFRGEMSFVGPRPERPEFVEKLKADIPYYGFRHSVKPGITGWAQVRYRYGASIEDTIEKLRYDLCYIKNRTLLLDVSILIETVKIVLMREGAR